MKGNICSSLYLKFFTTSVSLRLWALVFMVSIASLSVTFSASALSDYDNVVQVTDNLKLYNDEYNNVSDEDYINLKNYDFKYNWAVFTEADVLDDPLLLNGTPYNVMVGSGNVTQADGVVSWNNKKNWAVSQTTNGTDKRIVISYTTFEDSSLEFNNPPGWGRMQLSSEEVTTYYIVVRVINDSGIEVSYNKAEPGQHHALAFFVNESNNRKVLFVYWTIVYPSNYEGITPPDSIVIEETSDSQPDLNVLILSGFRVVIQDKNFNTIDNTPFLCNDDLTPVMYYELFKNLPEENQLIDSGVMSPTVQYQRQLENAARTYTFVAWYSCGPSPELQFSNTTFMQFQANQFGTQVTECSDDMAGFICKMSQTLNVGIFSATFNGFTNTIQVFGRINPSFCNTNWTATSNFESDIIPVQNIPNKVCSFANSYYLPPNSPFHTFTVWLNVLMSGAAILLFVFGLLSILGFKVRLGSPLEDEAGDPTSSRPDIKTSPTISRHRGTYSRGKSNGRSGHGLGG